LVVDVDSGEYALADDELEAFARAREKTPEEGVLFLIRVGHRAAHRIGASPATASGSTDSDARTRGLRRTSGCRTPPGTRLGRYLR
jgi:hypothetical protein